MPKGKNQDFVIAFGKNLSHIRKKLNFTQESLADASGLTLSQIGRIERAKINTTLDTVKQIADALDIDVHELFEFRN